MKHGKRYRKAVEELDQRRVASDLGQAVGMVKQLATAKFDETIEISAKLGVDPRHADQQVRGTVVLPHGTGRSVKVLVIAKGEKAKEAQAAGAELVGAEDMVAKIQEGWIDFDKVVATPDMMGQVGKLGRVLVPLGGNSCGKIRIEVRGQMHDYLAKTSDDAIEPGAFVLIEEIRDGIAQVSRAPDDLVPRDSPKRS